jgi:hypothetical protein
MDMGEGLAFLFGGGVVGEEPDQAPLRYVRVSHVSAIAPTCRGVTHHATAVVEPGMGLFKDEYGLKGWAIIALPIAGIFLFLAILVPAMMIGNVHVVHVDCLRLHEATGKPTKVVASGADRDCYIQVGGAWIPADRYRGVEVDGN